MIASNATTISRARVSGVRNADRALATRLRVEGLLAGADLRPPGLPPSAVLIVNQLALPADRRLSVRPGGRLDPAWERAARDAMADLYRRAARPLDSQPSSGCPAVLFRDEAELLACLALDISRGRAAERWWWRAYARRWGSLTPGVLSALLADTPRSVPVAVRILAERGVVVQVLQHLSSREDRMLLRVVCDEFDVPQIELSATRITGQPQRPATADLHDAAVEPGGDAAPWHSFIPAGMQPSALTPESVCLLGVSLTLAHSPSVAQSTAFVRSVEQWWQAEAHARRRASSVEQLVATQLVPAPPDTTSLADDGLFTPQSIAARADYQPAIQPRPDESPGVSELPTFPKVGNSELPAADAAVQLAGLQTSGRSDLARIVELADRDLVQAQTVEPALSLDGVFTELGGVLFLINLMQRLELPACFEEDWRLASAVGPWGVLELLARALLSEGLPNFPKVCNPDLLATDPLWSALATLDGRRPGELPGDGMTVPDQLRVPAGWLPWLDSSPVIARRLGDEAISRWRVEIASPGLAMTVTTKPLLAGVSRDALVWLAGVTPLLRQMLQRVLGDDCDIVSDLLLRRGQLYVTSTHVDLVMPLAAVSMPVRIAGLDFDPRWLPAFGRVVQFHYE